MWDWDWDETKRRSNRAKHGVDFAAIVRFDWETATFEEDRRRDYGEVRVVSVGNLDGRLHICTWTPRGGRPRLINLRKANDREKKAYYRARAPH
ncbi:BrnT family toxin [Frigidibacter sp. ROC022]|uniref:BrnT family toxin n=1 Tax=Frigidibacter sp. ROC022 TaxID=2971796 RepID=UPI00215A134E|nr:BrnT family toxin [Frigidibacter sp. ROC022]MCR8724003.1 BrnT family toxin [Frigidibacter sp. ROC022]